MEYNDNFEMNDFFVEFDQMDYERIIKVLGFAIITLSVNKIATSYTLHKDSKVKNIKKVILPPELTIKYDDINFDKLAANSFREKILNFTKVILKNFSKENLINFYNNLNELNINVKKVNLLDIIINLSVMGTYDARKNAIKVYDDAYDLTVYHELFHMASSIFKDNVQFSGFCQKSMKPFLILGNSLNEGYTQLLTERYFSSDENKDELERTYQYEMCIAGKLEDIVGKEKMQNLYLNSNLKGLINELENYTSNEEIMQFISELDFLSEHLYNNKILPFERNNILNKLKNINTFLIKTYMVKLKKELNNGELIEEINNKLSNFKKSLPYKIKNQKKDYIVSIDEEFLKIIKSNLEFDYNIIEETEVNKKI